MTVRKKKTKLSMINVGGKKPTHRTATAQATVSLPSSVLALVDGGDIQTKKGAVFQTASIAGVMAAKKTSELIPLCHPIGVEHCDVNVRISRTGEAVIKCQAEAHDKTGVEMEALTGASIAALTIYDMCKYLSHGIVIKEIKLLEKKGGKSDYAK